ncbi:MAG TPA: DUF58 domain-containing protein [Tissierellia bacterium]|nr:DUF58 domain-containing protein [Tissierellia bacterium]
MTLRLVLWLIALIATILISQLQERVFSPYLILFLGLLAPVSLIYDALFHRLKLRLIPQDEMVQRGEPAAWQLKLSNTDANRTHFLSYTRSQAGQTLTERKLHLPPKSHELIDIAVDTRHCGLQPPPSFSLGYLSLFGLFRLPLGRRLKAGFEPVYVLPAVTGSLEEPTQFGDLIKLGQLQASGREANHDEVDYMREMVPGDPMRLIHWKLSARMQDWMVRHFAKAQEKSVHVLLELPALDQREATLELRDELLERVATEIRGFLYHDFQVSLMTLEPELLIQTVRGLDRFDSLRRQLAVIAPKPAVPLVAQLAGDLGERGSLVYYIAVTALSREAAEALSELQRTSGGVLLEILGDELSPTEKDLVSELKGDGLAVVITPRRGGEHA